MIENYISTINEKHLKSYFEVSRRDFAGCWLIRTKR